jgi:redox-sensitive bicupin YhaK (pirin superfamily)
MYHGERVPGFPQHPHRGFETITATLTGIIDHCDSLGNAGRYGFGDLQWMTAGSGVVHGEMFPLLNDSKPNPLRFFQIWLNLPSKNKMTDPAFVMHWGPDVSKLSTDGVQVIVWAGSLEGKSGLAPPPKSWASEPDNEVAIWHIQLQAGASYTLPAAKSGAAINRALYFIEGSTVSIEGETLSKKVHITLDASKPTRLENPSGAVAELLMLQGRPLGEPVAQYGPFVMTTDAEIRQAFEDYQQTKFGGWPWPKDDHVFPRDKGRFALMDGVESNPPPDAGSCEASA